MYNLIKVIIILFGWFSYNNCIKIGDKMDNTNKNYIIYILLGIIVLLTVYILLQKPERITVVKTETVVDEIIIYKDIECPSTENKLQVTESHDLEIIENKDIKNEFIIASTYDSTHSYQIFILSYEAIIPSIIFEKIVLNGRLKKDGQESIFILDLNKKILENMNEVYFKIVTNTKNKSYLANADCLQNLIENYIYKINLEISGDEITCGITEDRELDSESKEHVIGEKIKTELKGKFLSIKPTEFNP